MNPREYMNIQNHFFKAELDNELLNYYLISMECQHLNVFTETLNKNTPLKFKYLSLSIKLYFSKSF